MRTAAVFIVVVLLAAGVFESPARADDANWPRFRGPNGQGIGQAEAIPVTWTEKDYNWKVELPGGGHSSPVIWGEKVFVT
ncbi:MAG TPA: serine/threonine protein kinase, partial [Phycisphaerae bacterium]|nr:serine/threonine protein kinase [Phycisphaerae bacterium]